jgi:hypothetical protein
MAASLQVDPSMANRIFMTIFSFGVGQASTDIIRCLKVKLLCLNVAPMLFAASSGEMSSPMSLVAGQRLAGSQLRGLDRSLRSVVLSSFCPY